jgi:hypothetical protein
VTPPMLEAAKPAQPVSKGMVGDAAEYATCGSRHGHRIVRGGVLLPQGLNDLSQHDGLAGACDRRE